MAIIIASTILVGCSSNKGNITITTDDAEYVVHVHGSNDFFEPVPGTYEVKEKNGVLTTTIEFVVVEKYDDPDYVVKKFILEPTDKDDYTIEINNRDIEFSAENLYSVYQKLATASVGDVQKVTFKYVLPDKNLAASVLQSIVSCDVRIRVEEPEETPQRTTTTTNSRSASSSANWDEVLNAYERYADQYIAVLKKASAGDAGAYAEMTTLLEQCNELSEKLSSADDEMSAAQMARFQKIMNKFANAASSL